jgi:HK97 gp10 family phage protein
MIDVKIEGVEELGNAVKKLGKRIRADIGREALVSALTPLVNAAKRHAKKSRDTGALESSIGFRVKPYKRNAGFFAVVGPRRGFNGPDGRNPIKYGHLVEFGHYSAASSLRFGGGRKGKKIKYYDARSFILPQPFMRPAWRETKDGMIAEMGRVMGQRIAIEVAARGKRRARKAI